MVFPVADELKRRGIPFLLVTAMTSKREGLGHQTPESVGVVFSNFADPPRHAVSALQRLPPGHPDVPSLFHSDHPIGQPVARAPGFDHMAPGTFSRWSRCICSHIEQVR